MISRQEQNSLPSFMQDKRASRLLQELGEGIDPKGSSLPNRLLSDDTHQQVFLYDFSSDEVLVKRNSGSNDCRVACGREHAFLNFLWSMGCREIQQSIAVDENNHWLILSAPEGNQPTAMDSKLIQQFMNFIGKINSFHKEALKAGLTPAKEACFCPNEYVASVNTRVSQMVEGALSGDYSPQVGEWILRELRPCWQRQRQQATRSIQIPQNWSYQLSQQQRYLSPANFSIQNCRQNSKGEILFVDFEDAGWDDPAKLVLDFCLHPKNELTIDSLKPMLEMLTEKLEISAEQASEIWRRINWLRPILQVRWACVLVEELQLDPRAVVDPSRAEQFKQLKIAQQFLDSSHAHCLV